MTGTALPFSDLVDQITGRDGAPWLQALRGRGFSEYRETGIPTVKQEAWKYTRLKTLEDSDFRIAGPEDAKQALDLVPGIFDDESRAARLVFVNGFYRADLSDVSGLPDGCVCESLAEALAREDQWLEDALTNKSDVASDGLIALNTAALQDGYVLRVSQGTVVNGPIEIVLATGLSSEPLASFPRNVIVMAENTRARLVIHYHGAGAGAGFSNAVTSVDLAQNAQLSTVILSHEGTKATAFSATCVSQDLDSAYDSFHLSVGGQITRHEQYVSLDGSGADCRLDGAYLMQGEQHCDHTTRIDHRVPNTTSNEMFKGVLDDASRAVFQGKIIVHPDAQQTDGRMLNKTMLLSDSAEIDTKPELEIYADDVKCAHGATSGQVDETALFYLQSRGIPEHMARSLLIQSFLGEVTDRIADETLRDYVRDRIVSWLSGGGNAE